MSDRLTTNQGAPVPDDQHSLSAGPRGPLLLEDHRLLEKLAHFNRERIPERVVGARGAAAFGTFVPVDGLSPFTTAAVFTRDRTTPVAARFSLFSHSREAPETTRDLRGFTVKFYTSEGTYDLVGSSLPVFFIRDGMRFPDLVHALRPNPTTGLPDVERTFDFLSRVPEATHALIWLYSDHGIPKTYRHMPGYSVDAYVWINSRGEPRFVKYHWKPLAGEDYFTQDEAAALQSRDVNHATRDLYATLKQGSVVEYDLFVQLMTLDEQSEMRVDVLDPTVLWPEERWPLIRAGRMTLNRAPLNEFAESEQLAASPSATVPGIEVSPDKLLQARSFAYPDAQLHRLGTNYLQLPVNRPRIGVHNHQQDGSMAFEFSGSDVNYAPSAAGDRFEPARTNTWRTPLGDTAVREEVVHDDFTPAGETWRSFSGAMRLSVIRNLGDALRSLENRRALELIAGYLKQADGYLGDAVLRRAQGRLDDLTAVIAELSPPAASAEPAVANPAAEE